MRDEILNAESKFQTIHNQKVMFEASQERVTEEMKIYVSKKPEDKHKS